MNHPLRKARLANGLTITELAELSGISEGTISKIENGTSEYRTNQGVAIALARALYQPVGALFNSAELSHLGRPPHTGTPIGIGEISRIFVISQHEMLCSCGLIVPKAAGCDTCPPAKVMG